MRRRRQKLPAAYSFGNNQRIPWWKRFGCSRRQRADSRHFSSTSRQSNSTKHISKRNLGDLYPRNCRKASTPLCRYDSWPTQTRTNVVDGSGVFGSAGVVRRRGIFPVRHTPDPELFRRRGSIHLFWPAVVDDRLLGTGCGTLRTHIAGTASTGRGKKPPHSAGVPNDVCCGVGDRLLLSQFHFLACIYLDQRLQSIRADPAVAERIPLVLEK